MADFMIELRGTPDEIQEMLNKASRIEGVTAYRKKRISEDVYYVWYRGKGAPNDLIAAIKREAGLVKKRTSRPRKQTPDEAEPVTSEETQSNDE